MGINCFLGAYDITFIDYLEKEKFITRKYRASALIKLLPKLWTHDYVRLRNKYSFIKTIPLLIKDLLQLRKLHEMLYELLPHSQHSPDFVPSGCVVLSGTKKMF